MVNELRIDGVSIGRGRCYIIAEAGVNHDGSVERAHALIDVAADAAADAVKFQTFRPELLASAAAPKAAYAAWSRSDRSARVTRTICGLK